MLILGTSPVLLIEGVLRARCGQRVLLLEGGSRIGGVWATTELGELRDIESACHLLEDYRGAYDFMSRELGIALEVCDPQPLAIDEAGRTTLYNARTRNLRRLARLAARVPVVASIRALERLSGHRLQVRRTAGFRLREALVRLAVLSRHRFLGRSGTAMHYLSGGTPRFLHDLTGELERHGARLLRSRVAQLDLEGAGVVARLDDGREIHAHQLVVSESACVDSIAAGGHRFDFDSVTTVHPHLVLEVTMGPDRLCGYVHLQGDPFVARVSDVTASCTGHDPERGSRILVVQLRAAAVGEDPELAERALAHLVERGALEPGVGLLRARRATVETCSAVPSVAGFLRELDDGRVTVLRSLGDLALSVLANRRRWRGLLAARRERTRDAQPRTARLVPVAGAPAGSVEENRGLESYERRTEAGSVRR